MTVDRCNNGLNRIEMYFSMIETKLRQIVESIIAAQILNTLYLVTLPVSTCDFISCSKKTEFQPQYFIFQLARGKKEKRFTYLF